MSISFEATPQRQATHSYSSYSDASFTAALYAIMIEDDPNQKLQSKRKTYAPIVFVPKHSTQHKQKCQYLRKNSFPCKLPLPNLGTSCGVKHSPS